MEVVLTEMGMWRGISSIPGILWHCAVRAMMKFISVLKRVEKRGGLYECNNDINNDLHHSGMCDELICLETDACLELAKFYDKEPK